MKQTTTERTLKVLWPAVERVVNALPLKFDTSELRKAISYLVAHENNVGRLLRYLQVLAASSNLVRSRQTLDYRKALWQAVQQVKDLPGEELAWVLAQAARILARRKHSGTKERADRRGR